MGNATAIEYDTTEFGYVCWDRVRFISLDESLKDEADEPKVVLWATGPYELEIHVVGKGKSGDCEITLDRLHVRSLIGQLQAFLDTPEEDFPADRKV